MRQVERKKIAQLIKVLELTLNLHMIAHSKRKSSKKGLPRTLIISSSNGKERTPNQKLATGCVHVQPDTAAASTIDDHNLCFPTVHLQYCIS